MRKIYTVDDDDFNNITVKAYEGDDLYIFKYLTIHTLNGLLTLLEEDGFTYTRI